MELFNMMYNVIFYRKKIDNVDPSRWHKLWFLVKEGFGYEVPIRWSLSNTTLSAETTKVLNPTGISWWKVSLTPFLPRCSLIKALMEEATLTERFEVSVLAKKPKPWRNASISSDDPETSLPQVNDPPPIFISLPDRSSPEPIRGL
ncbi:hypothetical protein LIER_08076 [Lithospermum erythrorhizon]|uniref:Uncharacterized protein n=1 Tax=Lithospermum erythrorhizon TaxID=34254 RepID=A0AAV3PAS6_LITER